MYQPRQMSHTHISRANMRPAVCHAKYRCPFGDCFSHYDSPATAERAIQAGLDAVARLDVMLEKDGNVVDANGNLTKNGANIVHSLMTLQMLQENLNEFKKISSRSYREGLKEILTDPDGTFHEIGKGERVLFENINDPNGDKNLLSCTASWVEETVRNNKLGVSGAVEIMEANGEQIPMKAETVPAEAKVCCCLNKDGKYEDSFLDIERVRDKIVPKGSSFNPITGVIDNTGAGRVTLNEESAEMIMDLKGKEDRVSVYNEKANASTQRIIEKFLNEGVESVNLPRNGGVANFSPEYTKMVIDKEEIKQTKPDLVNQVTSTTTVKAHPSVKISMIKSSGRKKGEAPIPVDSRISTGAIVGEHSGELTGYTRIKNSTENAEKLKVGDPRPIRGGRRRR